jgi:hypothetical protein
VYQQVKAEHQRPEVVKILEILVWKEEHITIDFIIRLPSSKLGKDII